MAEDHLLTTDNNLEGYAIERMLGKNDVSGNKEERKALLNTESEYLKDDFLFSDLIEKIEQVKKQKEEEQDN